MTTSATKSEFSGRFKCVTQRHVLCNTYLDIQPTRPNIVNGTSNLFVQSDPRQRNVGYIFGVMHDKYNNILLHNTVKSQCWSGHVHIHLRDGRGCIKFACCFVVWKCASDVHNIFANSLSIVYMTRYEQWPRLIPIVALNRQRKK